MGGIGEGAVGGKKIRRSSKEKGETKGWRDIRRRGEIIGLKLEKKPGWFA